MKTLKDLSKQHTEEFIKEDARKIKTIFTITSIIFGLILLYVLLFPNARYDSEMDNLPKLLYCIVFAITGIMLCENKHTQKFMRIYVILYFITLSIYEFNTSAEKSDALFVFLILCCINAVTLHINPIAYSIIVLLTYSYMFVGLYNYFNNSIGTMISLTVLILTLILLEFDDDLTLKARLENLDNIIQNKKLLKIELERKSNEIINNIKKQSTIQESIILAIANLVENRDMDTGTHIKATSYYVDILSKHAYELGVYPDEINETFVSLIAKAAPMHDLGKICIPDAILKAPRRLTTEEFEIMKTHTIEGARIVKNIYTDIESDEYITYATNVAKYHHERWDGRGYPEGLSGTNIPLEARVMSIADVFDALISKRCYKDNFPLEEAFDEIKINSGTQFDPILVKVFLEMREEIEANIIKGFED